MSTIRVSIPRELWPSRSDWRGKVIDVKIRPGDKVSPGDPLVEIEIEKAVIVLESDYEGLVREVFVRKGDYVKPGDLVALIETS